MDGKKGQRRVAVLLGLLLVSCAASQASGENELTASGSHIKVSSSELANSTFKYDGKDVVYFGELVGVFMNRGQYSWFNVHDGGYAIGMYVPTGLLNETGMLGGYHQKGDMIEVSGVFNRACREHGGDMDIHAKSVRIIAGGYAMEHPLNTSKMFFTLLLVVVNIPLLIVLGRMKDAA